MTEPEEAITGSPKKSPKKAIKEAAGDGTNDVLAEPAAAAVLPASTEKKIIQKITIESDPVKAAKRKERFGLPEKEAVEVKKSKRAMRFGSEGGASIPSTPEIEEKKKARAERFGKGTVEVEEKKKARSARFGAATN